MAVLTGHSSSFHLERRTDGPTCTTGLRECSCWAHFLLTSRKSPLSLSLGLRGGYGCHRLDDGRLGARIQAAELVIDRNPNETCWGSTFIERGLGIARSPLRSLSSQGITLTLDLSFRLNQLGSRRSDKRSYHRVRQGCPRSARIRNVHAFDVYQHARGDD